jgi:OOP family OmpA-OmpF porin
MSLKRALLATALVSTAMLAPGLASAQPVTGLYIGAGAGANWINNPEKFDLSGDTVRGNFGLPQNTTINNVGKANFKAGWGGVASIGYGFGNGFRAEIEGNYRTNEVDSIRGFGLAPVGRVGGYQSTYGAMANVFYDFDFANFGLGQSIFQPYVGLGAGYVWTDWRNIRGQGANGLVIQSNDTDGQFAYQGIVGVATPLTWLGVTGLTLTAEYRFLGTLQPSMDVNFRSPTTNAVVRGGKIDSDNYNHSVMLGLRYALFQPPPAPPPVAEAPPPAAVPAPARTYLVFFDWDRADLTTRAREIIGEAAQNSRRVQATRIEVAGHADRSGSPQYNQRLSQRRADAVAAELVRQGVSRNEIMVTAFGESRPLVPTADGVREPQNRRVEIVLR